MIKYYFYVCFLCTTLSASEKSQLVDKKGNIIPLMVAIKEENEPLVASLLQQGALTNIENSCDEYPIHVAMEWDIEQHIYPQRKIQPNIVKLLLQHKANPNTRYPFKNATPLHAAVFHNSQNIVRKLLRYGADKTLYDERGFTPLALAKFYKFERIISILSLNVISNYTPPARLKDLIASFYLVDPDVKIHQSFASTKIIDDYKEKS